MLKSQELEGVLRSERSETQLLCLTAFLSFSKFLCPIRDGKHTFN